MSDTGHDMKKNQDNPLNVFINFNCDEFFVKIELNGSKRQWGSKIAEKWLNDVICLTMGMV